MLALLKNPDLIAINQDRAVRPIVQCNDSGDDGFSYAKMLENGDLAFALTNYGDKVRTIRVRFAEIGLALGGEWEFRLRDCGTGEDFGKTFTDGFSAEVGPHCTRVFRGKPVKSI